MGLHTKQLGRDSVRQTTLAAKNAYSLSWSDAGKTIIHNTSDPEVIIAEYTMNIHGNVKGKDRTIEVSDVLVMRVRDGKFVEIRAYSNAQYLLAQIL